MESSSPNLKINSYSHLALLSMITLEIDDLNALISSLKKREETYIQILDFCTKYQDYTLFEIEELSRYYNDHMNILEKERIKRENDILEKYAKYKISETKDKKLMIRLINKIIQLNTSVKNKIQELKICDQAKEFIKDNIFFEEMLKSYSQKSSMNVDIILTYLVNYYRQKFQNASIKLKNCMNKYRDGYKQEKYDNNNNMTNGNNKNNCHNQIENYQNDYHNHNEHQNQSEQHVQSVRSNESDQKSQNDYRNQNDTRNSETSNATSQEKVNIINKTEKITTEETKTSSDCIPFNNTSNDKNDNNKTSHYKRKNFRYEKLEKVIPSNKKTNLFRLSGKSPIIDNDSNLMMGTSMLISKAINNEDTPQDEKLLVLRKTSSINLPSINKENDCNNIGRSFRNPKIFRHQSRSCDGEYIDTKNGIKTPMIIKEINQNELPTQIDNNTNINGNDSPIPYANTMTMMMNIDPGLISPIQGVIISNNNSNSNTNSKADNKSDNGNNNIMKNDYWKCYDILKPDIKLIPISNNKKALLEKLYNDLHNNNTEIKKTINQYNLYYKSFKDKDQPKEIKESRGRIERRSISSSSIIINNNKELKKAIVIDRNTQNNRQLSLIPFHSKTPISPNHTKKYDVNQDNQHDGQNGNNQQGVQFSSQQDDQQVGEQSDDLSHTKSNRTLQRCYSIMPNKIESKLLNITRKSTSPIKVEQNHHQHHKIIHQHNNNNNNKVMAVSKLDLSEAGLLSIRNNNNNNNNSNPNNIQPNQGIDNEFTHNINMKKSISRFRSDLFGNNKKSDDFCEFTYIKLKSNSVTKDMTNAILDQIKNRLIFKKNSNSNSKTRYQTYNNIDDNGININIKSNLRPSGFEYYMIEGKTSDDLVDTAAVAALYPKKFYLPSIFNERKTITNNKVKKMNTYKSMESPQFQMNNATFQV